MTAIRKNTPTLWLDQFPFPKEEQHKYDRGHAVIFGGPTHCTGAAKLAALAALRIGAGLSTILCPQEALNTYAESLTAVMTAPYNSTKELEETLNDPRKTALLIGPGNGTTETTKNNTLLALKTQKPIVIDADAITIFQHEPETLFKHLHPNAILTPHEGEFNRIFSLEGTNQERAQQAAKHIDATLLLKGHHTIIATPNGTLTINENAPPTLATAGSGDVLAGMITGLAANSIPLDQAACMASWIHGECANLLGLGLISEDLVTTIPTVIQQLAKDKSS